MGWRPIELKEQFLSYWGKFQWLFYQGKGNLVRVSGEFELTEWNRLEIQGKSDLFKLVGSLNYPS